jgi:hypothetical protein
MTRREKTGFSAVSIRARGDIPRLFQEHFRNLVGDDEPFPRTVLLYPDKNAFGKTNATLVFAHARGVAVCEKEKNATRVLSFAYNDIHGVERGLILLYSWFTISGTIDGAPARLRIKILKPKSRTSLLLSGFRQSIRLILYTKGTPRKKLSFSFFGVTSETGACFCSSSVISSRSSLTDKESSFIFSTYSCLFPLSFTVSNVLW